MEENILNLTVATPKVQTGVRFSVETLESLDAIADKLGKSRSELIVEAVESYWGISPDKAKTTSEVYSKILNDIYQLEKRVIEIEKFISKEK